MSVYECKYIPELPNVPATGVNAVAIIFWFYAFCLWECLLPVHRAKLLHCSIGHAGFKAVIGCGHGASRLWAVRVTLQSTLSAAVSTDRRNTCIETLCGSLISQHHTWSLVELSCYGAQLCLTMYRQIRALWKVLSQQAVGVFV
jgi:hypothetical protein